MATCLRLGSSSSTRSRCSTKSASSRNVGAALARPAASVLRPPASPVCDRAGPVPRALPLSLSSPRAASAPCVAQNASALGASGTRLCAHACGARRGKALPCPATPSGRPHGTCIPPVADGWSTNSLEVTLNPTTLKSKVLTPLPAPGSAGHCLALFPPLTTCSAPRRVHTHGAPALTRRGFLSGPVDCEGSASGHDM